MQRLLNLCKWYKELRIIFWILKHFQKYEWMILTLNTGSPPSLPLSELLFLHPYLHIHKAEHTEAYFSASPSSSST